MMGLLIVFNFLQDRNGRAHRPGGRPRRRGGAGGDPGPGARAGAGHRAHPARAQAGHPALGTGAAPGRRRGGARGGRLCRDPLLGRAAVAGQRRTDGLADRAAAREGGALDRDPVQHHPRRARSAVRARLRLGRGRGGGRDPAVRRRQDPGPARGDRARGTGPGRAGGCRPGERPGARRAWPPCSGSTATSSCAPSCSPPRSCSSPGKAPSRGRWCLRRTGSCTSCSSSRP